MANDRWDKEPHTQEGPGEKGGLGGEHGRWRLRWAEISNRIIWKRVPAKWFWKEETALPNGEPHSLKFYIRPFEVDLSPQIYTSVQKGRHRVPRVQDTPE